jgi:hypothetical protein
MYHGDLAVVASLGRLCRRRTEPIVVAPGRPLIGVAGR